MTASILTEEPNPADAALSPWPPAHSETTPARRAASPGMALMRRLGLRRRALLLALCAVVPAIAVLAWMLRGELLALSVSSAQLRGLAQSEILLSAAMVVHESQGDTAAGTAAAADEPLARLGVLLARLRGSMAAQPDLGRQLQLLRQQVAELNRAAAAGGAAAGAAGSERIEPLRHDLEALQHGVRQALALQRDADARVRDVAIGATDALPLLASSLQASLHSARDLSSADAAQRRDLVRRLVEQRAEAALAFEQARVPLQRSVAARWLGDAAVAATLAALQTQLAAMDRLARAAQADTAPGAALLQDYLRHTQRSLGAVAQLQSQGLGVLRDALQQRHDAQLRRAGLLAAGAAAWLLAVTYLLLCAARLLTEAVRTLRDEVATLPDTETAPTPLPARPGDELAQAHGLVRRAAQRQRQWRADVAATGEALARDAQGAAAEQAALSLRAGEIRGACGDAAQRMAAFGEIFDDCALSAEAALAEVLALADDALHGRHTLAGLRTRLLAASGSNREVAHVVQNVEVVAQQTRRLALNAIAEAERLGAPGQAFAVLLQELRALAQRNEQAARGLHPVIAATVIEIDDCHRASELASHAEQDTERRLLAVQRSVTELVRRAEHGSGESRQMLQSARRVEGGLDDLIGRVERLAQALAMLRDQGRTLQTAVQA